MDVLAQTVQQRFSVGRVSAAPAPVPTSYTAINLIERKSNNNMRQYFIPRVIIQRKISPFFLMKIYEVQEAIPTDLHIMEYHT